MNRARKVCLSEEKGGEGAAGGAEDAGEHQGPKGGSQLLEVLAKVALAVTGRGEIMCKSNAVNFSNAIPYRAHLLRYSSKPHVYCTTRMHWFTKAPKLK